MWKQIAICLTALSMASVLSFGQTAPATRPSDRVIGTVTAVDGATHSVTVKEDKTGTEYVAQLASAKTLIKVAPGAKDLAGATRITADDLAVGDRVQIGGAKTPDNPNTIVARSVILMSARELQQLHQEQQAAWQHSTPGVVTAVDAAGHKLNVTARTPEGTKPLVVDAASAQFTRYSPETPKTPVASELAEIQPGDQVRIIGQPTPDGLTMNAQKIYSSSFRTVVGTVSAISADGKEITIKNLQTKQPMTITLNDDSAVRRLPPMLAYGLARRFNPDFKGRPGGQAAGTGGPAGNTSGPASTAGAPPDRAKAGEAQPGGTAAGGQANHGMRGNGDLSQILERLPKIGAGDLKPGDAVVISGSPEGTDKSHLLATNVIAGVEPIFQSASPRQAQSLGDWGASLGGGHG